MSLPSLQDVIARHRKAVLSLPDVNGVAGGISPKTPGKVCILVYVSDASTWPPGLAREIEGYDVKLVGGGEFHAM